MHNSSYIVQKMHMLYVKHYVHLLHSMGYALCCYNVCVCVHMYVYIYIYISYTVVAVAHMS